MAKKRWNQALSAHSNGPETSDGVNLFFSFIRQSEESDSLVESDLEAGVLNLELRSYAMFRSLAAFVAPGLLALLAAIIAALIAALATAPAFASPDRPMTPICGKRTELVGKLKSQYSERPVANGLATNGGILEVLASPAGSSWTIVLTMPDGTSCLVAAGENWETAAKFAIGKGI